MEERQRKKQKRNRSPEKKAAQFERILETGKKLFLEKGQEGFSLRNLAKKLGMNQNNIYNYVDSKRELWIAIRKNFYEQYRKEIILIIKKHQGSPSQLLLKIFKYFLDFAENDYYAFWMMHISEAPSPPIDKNTGLPRKGVFEKEYKSYNFLEGTTKIIQSAIDAGEILEKNAALISYFLFSLTLGVAIVEKNIYLFGNPKSFNITEADETPQYDRVDFTSKDFRNYVLKKIELGLKDPFLSSDENDFKN